MNILIRIFRAYEKDTHINYITFINFFSVFVVKSSELRNCLF